MYKSSWWWAWPMTMDSTRHLESEKTTLPWKRNWISKDFIAEEKLRLQHGGERTYEDESESEKINAYKNQIKRWNAGKRTVGKTDWVMKSVIEKKRVDLSDKAKIKVRSTSPWSEFSPRAFWAASLIIHLDCQEIWLVGAVG